MFSPTSASAATLETFIRTSAWGRALSEADLQAVLSAARELRLRPGGHLVRDGEPAQHWVGLIDGFVIQQVTSEEGRQAVLTVAGDGMWFGEGTLMKRGTWQYDAIARRDTRAALIPLRTFQWLLDTSLPFNQFIARLLNHRLSHYMGLLATERLTHVEQRLARVLAGLFDPDLYPARPPLLRMTQSDIALLCGMSRQRANVALKQLEAQGLLEVQRLGVRVLDVERLRGL